MEILAQCASDHAPVLAIFHKHRPQKRCGRGSVFRYEKAWHKFKDHKEVIRKAWRVKQNNRGGMEVSTGKTGGK